MNAVVKFAICTALITAFVFPAAAHAITPRGRLVVGKVQHIDRQKHRAELLPSDGSKPFIFAWSNATTFLRDSEFAGPDAMYEGMTLQVTRVMPFFGDLQAIKIVMPVLTEKPRLKKDATAVK